MGLDQYLHAKKYLSEYNEKTRDLKEKIQESLPPGTFPVCQIECKAIYWRKANAIHNFFVTTCQGGVDDCREVFVERAQLRELIDRIDQVLDDNSQAEELLPPVSGFFFGSTEIDENYFEDLRYTKEKLEEVLDPKFADWDFYYLSSW